MQQVPFFLHEVVVLSFLEECEEHDVVGEEVHVGSHHDGVVMYAVVPDGVGSDVGFCRWCEFAVGEGDLLAFLVEEEVLVLVGQCVCSVFSRCYSFDGEVSATIGSRDPLEGLCAECAVFHVGVESYEYSLDGFEVFGIEYCSRHLESVYSVASGEGESVVAHGIAFVVVLDGVGEVDGVGRAVLERVHQFDGDASSHGVDFRHFQLGRRHHDFFCGVVEFDILVELQYDFLCPSVGGVLFGAGAYDFRRILVIGSAIGCSDVGA